MPAKSNQLLNFRRLIQTSQPFCRYATTGKRKPGRNAGSTFAKSTTTTSASNAGSVERSAANSVRECEQLIASLRASVVTGSRVSFGVCRLPDDAFTLYYGKPGLDNIARRISLDKATPAELQQLTRACDPAEAVLGASAGQLDVDAFAGKFDVERAGLLRCISLDLLTEQQRNQLIKAQLCKINVYSKGGLLAPLGTPRIADSYGSLVVVFPTTHAGGASVLRCGNKEWRFDPAQALSAVNQPAVAFIAFASDVQHEVLPVESGHRVTLTYNLSLTLPEIIGCCPVSQTAVDSETRFRDTLTALLANPSFLPKGGLLGFGLQYQYPPLDAENRTKAFGTTLGQLQGSDAAIKRICEALSLPVRLKILTKGDVEGQDDGAVLTDHVIRIEDCPVYRDESPFEMMAKENGAIVLLPDGYVPDDCRIEI